MKLLTIDDDSQTLELITTALCQDGLEILTANDPQAGLDLFLSTRPEIVLLDLVMPGVSGLDLLERMVAADPGADIVLITGHYSTESAVEAIQKGACDYLTKPLDLGKLRRRIANLLANAEERKRALALDHELLSTFQLEGIVGRSPLMLEMFQKVRRVAPHFRTLLVGGETGTGKELVARVLHRLSPADPDRFVVCNCSAIVETLLESELFGYVRGAFTGATQDKVGLFEYAHGGTVFLDEVGEMPMAAQAKLLRVLQNRELQRVGSPIVRKIDVRVIAATNRDLRAQMAKDGFREDLYHRLAMVEINLPRLAERKEDLPLLIRHFTTRFAAEYKKEVRGVTRRAQALLARYPWPGNVRELENTLGSACMMAEGPVIDVHDLPASLRSPAHDQQPSDDGLVGMKELQRRHLLHVLERVGGNKVRAAEILGISRASVYQMLADMKKEGKAAMAVPGTPQPVNPA